jgi:hypothetical protein
VFAGLDPANYITGWSVWRLDPGYFYQRLGLDDTLDTQTGYWFFNSGPGYQVNTSGREPRSEIISLVNSSSTGRWNMIGHPHRAQIPWKDARIMDGANELTLDQADPDLGGGLGRACSQEPVDASCLVSSTMFVWNGNSYQSYNGSTPLMEGALDTFDGALVKAYKAGLSLRIPEAPSASAEADASGESKTDKHRRGDSWFVRLIAESGEYSDPGNALGQFEDSVDGLDKNDLPENPPFGQKYLTIVFPHDEWETGAWNYTSDYRAITKKPSGEWTFKVLASPDVEEVTLRWEGPEDILKKSRLIDVQTGTKVKAGKDDSYTFELVDGQAEFVFEVK